MNRKMMYKLCVLFFILSYIYKKKIKIKNILRALRNLIHRYLPTIFIRNYYIIIVRYNNIIIIILCERTCNQYNIILFPIIIYWYNNTILVNKNHAYTLKELNFFFNKVINALLTDFEDILIILSNTTLLTSLENIILYYNYMWYPRMSLKSSEAAILIEARDPIYVYPLLLLFVVHTGI